MSARSKTLTWGPWTLYHVATAGSKTLQVCDYLGESLANFFGITTPKYQYEIDEYHRSLAEEEERQRQLDLEMGGWTDKYSQQVISLEEVTQPSSTNEIQQAGDSNRFFCEVLGLEQGQLSLMRTNEELLE
uniref:(California timema) hypothetical protein n=1 Tax=Timema californicum TaxID=61474 RepID=A0A7R9P3L0_TIMCA|nr:unnamed protein product [Timema californicum]